jgi:hypothetical protein
MNKIIFLLSIAFASCVSFAGDVSVSWEPSNKSANMFFNADSQIYYAPKPKYNNSKTNLSTTKEVETAKIIANNSPSILIINEKSPIIKIFGGCIPNINPNEEWVCIDDFYMMSKEVTNLEYRKFDKSHDSSAGFNRDSQPVVNVNLTDINKYISWLNETTDYTYRLPSSNEWKYAAIAGSSEINNSCENANVVGCYKTTKNTGSYSPNKWGLYDMFGNVAEFSSDNSISGGSWDSVESSFEDSKSTSVGFRLVIIK